MLQNVSRRQFLLFTAGAVLQRGNDRVKRDMVVRKFTKQKRAEAL